MSVPCKCLDVCGQFTDRHFDTGFGVRGLSETGWYDRSLNISPDLNIFAKASISVFKAVF
jgi:hypothetical protein